jgi:hypothetical protein
MTRREALRAAERLIARADALMPRVRAELLRAFERLAKRVPLAVWLEMVERWDGRRLTELVATLEGDLAKVEVLIETLRRDAARAAAVAFVPARGRFNLVNPLAVRSARNESARLVTEITASTRRGLQVLVQRAFTDGIPPRQLAKLIRPMVGLTARQSQSVLNRRARRLASGWEAARIEKDVTAYAERVRTRRAVTIARTETVKASVDGQVDAWKDAQRRGLLPPQALQQWMVTPDDRLCPQCSEMVGRRALAPIGGVFETPLGTKTGPPMHPNCRCAVVISTRSLALPRQRAA